MICTNRRRTRRNKDLVRWSCVIRVMKWWLMSDRISFTYSTSFAVADTPGSPNIKSSLSRQIISQRHIMIIWTLNIVSVECRHETNIQPRPWNNSFNTEDETAWCCGKNIEEILFLRYIFCGTETINNKEWEPSFLSIKVWVYFKWCWKNSLICGGAVHIIFLLWE